ncbi:hypothetical protein DFR52_103242 [Hoeflea marina]|uniref:Uncharacterized protein n=1 Tax=Hoeflea marina TaxID=274592 RepID=A0A317PNG8_9HYPH|nr:hypothetical protein DFR52_103242 [Hoeflea marina]
MPHLCHHQYRPHSGVRDHEQLCAFGGRPFLCDNGESQTKQGLLALYTHSERTGGRLRVASINRQIPYRMLDPFNPDYLRAVFADAYNQTVAGIVWKQTPIF